MKCLACDSILSDREDARKYVASGEHIGLCDPCFAEIENEVEYVGDSPKQIKPENEDITYEYFSET